MMSALKLFCVEKLSGLVCVSSEIKVGPELELDLLLVCFHSSCLAVLPLFSCLMDVIIAVL